MTHNVTAASLLKSSKRLSNLNYSLEFFEDIINQMERFEIDCGTSACTVRTISSGIHCEATADDLVDYVRTNYPDYADTEEYPDFDDIQDQIGYDGIIILHDIDGGKWCLIDFN